MDIRYKYHDQYMYFRIFLVLLLVLFVLSYNAPKERTPSHEHAADIDITDIMGDFTRTPPVFAGRDDVQIGVKHAAYIATLVGACCSVLLFNSYVSYIRIFINFSPRESTPSWRGLVRFSLPPPLV